MDDAEKLVRHAPSTTKNDVKEKKLTTSKGGNVSGTPIDSAHSISVIQQSQTSVSSTVLNENGASPNPSTVVSESNKVNCKQKLVGKKLGSINNKGNKNGTSIKNCATNNCISHLMKEVEQILSSMKKTFLSIGKDNENGEEEMIWYNSLSTEEKALIDEGVECILHGSLMKTARQTFDTVVRQRLANSKAEKRKQNKRQSKNDDGHSELYSNSISAHEKINSSGTRIIESKNTQNIGSNNGKSNTNFIQNINSNTASSQKQSFLSLPARSRQSSSQNRYHGDHDRNNERELGRYEENANYNHSANYPPHHINSYHHPSNFVSMSMPPMIMNHSNSVAGVGKLLKPPPPLSYRDNTINGNDINCSHETIPRTLHGTSMGPTFRYFEDYGRGGHVHGQSCDVGFTGNHSQMALPAYHSASSSRRLYSSPPSLNLDLDRDTHSSSRRDRDKDFERVRERDRDRIRNWDRDKDSDRDNYMSRERNRGYSSEDDRHHHRKRKRRERSRERNRSNSSESFHQRDRAASRRSSSHNRSRSHRNSRHGSSSSRRKNSRYASKSRIRSWSRSRSRSTSVDISSINRNSSRIYGKTERKQKDGGSKSNDIKNVNREISESARDPCHKISDSENKNEDGITGRNMTVSKDESYGSRQRKRSVSCDKDGSRSRSRSRSYGRKASRGEREFCGSRNHGRMKDIYSMQPSKKFSNSSGKGDEENTSKRWMRNSPNSSMAKDALNPQRSRSCSKDGVHERGRERCKRGNSHSKSRERDRKNERASCAKRMSFETSRRKDKNGNDRRGDILEQQFDQTDILDSEIVSDKKNSGKDSSNAHIADLYRHRERERERERKREREREQRERNVEREKDRKRSGQRQNRRK